jgi:cephalosporin hydroxylase
MPKNEIAIRRENSINGLAENKEFKKKSIDWIKDAGTASYPYNFDWLGIPIIQLPQDIVAIQEIIWRTRPRYIIETGIAHGGSLILHASILQLIAAEGEVIGIDIDIRSHNRSAIEAHPLSKRIHLIQGSSIDQDVVDKVESIIQEPGPILVILDSNHTHEHVMTELKLYSKFVSKDSYLIVMDTTIEDMPKGSFLDRPWDVGNSPKTAVHEFLLNNTSFEIDHEYDSKLLISAALNGYLKRVA